MDDSLQEKSIEDTVVNTSFQHAFCRHVVEGLFLLNFDIIINIHHCLYNCYIYML